MNAIAAISTQFNTLIEKEIGLMQALARTLAEEQTILIDNNVEALLVLTQEKNGLLGQITQIEKDRNTLLVQHGFGPDQQGMLELITAKSEESAYLHLQECWDSLLKISADAQELNRVNGGLINRQITRNQSTLNVLQSGGQAGSMYGADGQTKISGNASRGIIAG